MSRVFSSCPPGAPRSSAIALSSMRPAYIPAANPAGPAPTMITSYCFSDIFTSSRLLFGRTIYNPGPTPWNSRPPGARNHRLEGPELGMSGNDMRWKPGKRGHYEGYYVAFNHPQSGRGYWIRYSMVAPTDAEREPFAQVWFMRTDRAAEPRNRALRTTFPIASLTSSTAPFSIAIGGSALRADGCRGELSDGAGDVSWDLKFEPLLPGIVPTPEWGARMATCYIEPNPLLRLTGTITEAGAETSIDDWLGEQ